MNASAPLPDLDRLIADLGFPLPAPAFEPERLVYAVRFEALGVGPVPWRLARAQRELARLHLRELARLLRRAIVVRERAWGEHEPASAAERDCRCAERPEASAFLPRRPRREPRRPSWGTRWRRELEHALSLAAADGARIAPRLLEVLSRLLDSLPVSPSPSSSELARAALALHDCAAGRVALGEAWLREGRRGEAAAQLVEALRRRPSGATAARALAGLARARSSEGVRERRRNRSTECA